MADSSVLVVRIAQLLQQPTQDILQIYVSINKVKIIIKQEISVFVYELGISALDPLYLLSPNPQYLEALICLWVEAWPEHQNNNNNNNYSF